MPDVIRWEESAACRFVDPELFFYDEDERGKAKRQREAAARAVCHRCPVLAECRDRVLNVSRERYGFWAGMSEDEREEVWLARWRRENGRVAA